MKQRNIHEPQTPPPKAAEKAIADSEDISSVRDAEWERRVAESEERFGQGLFDLLPLPVFCEDVKGRYLWCNRAFCDFMGKPKEEILARTVFEVNASPAAQRYLEHDRQMMESKRTFEVRERLMLRGDGEHRSVITYKSLLTNLGEVDGIVGALLDITELKSAQAREEVYKEKLMSLASAFSVSKEQERCLIAQEIHDSISQNLAYSKLKLRFLEERFGGEVREELSEIVATIDDALQYTRTLTFELGVPVLYQLGLDAALQWLVGELHRKYGFTVRYRLARLPEKISDDMKAFLFRSAQELLTNAIKHSGVKEARLSVERKSDRIVVRVQDKGKGFDVYAYSHSDFSSKSYGLFSLETLVRSLGGEVEICSGQGRGTDVTLRIPCAETEREKMEHPLPSPKGHFE